MAEVNTDSGGGGKKKHGKQRAKKTSTRIDMTPMVDLGFLLLTFFILTTTFNKPQAMEISMPVKDETLQDDQKNKVPAEYTLNILLTKDDKIFWYKGLADPNKGALPALNKVSFGKDGLRKLLLDQNKKAYEKIEGLKNDVRSGKIKEDVMKEEIKKYREETKRTTLVVLIKPDKESKYKNIVDALDEMAVTNVGSYALLETNAVEDLMIADASKYN
jgi:biopolymer transport protein ExbD